MISDEDIRRVREATDLVDLVSESVVLKQRGRDFWGCCPFHDEKTPSFKVDPRSQLYHCFGCHVGGDVYGFAMRMQDMEFVDAVRYLADRANIAITETRGGLAQGRRARLLALMKESAEYYALQLLRGAYPGAKAARSYLSGRAMGTELAKRWQLGYAPGSTSLFDHLRAKGYSPEECLEANVIVKSSNGRLRDRFYERVIFPVADLQGRVIAFGGRIITDGQPKYLNTSETALFHKREALYAIDRAKAAITSSGTAIVVEGYTDTIAMHEAGFAQTVATLGTALTMQHLKLLNRFAKKIIYLFDGDEAGKRAAARAAELINRDITPEAGKFRVSLEVAELPPGMDPADFLAHEGTAALQKTLDKAVPLLKYALQQCIGETDLSSPERRNAALRSALAVLLPIRGSILASEYIVDELVPRLGVDYSAAMTLFNGMQEPRLPTAGGEEGARADGARTAGFWLQKDLVILYIEYPEVRELLAQAFERIMWDSDELTALSKSLIASDPKAESDELYALALRIAPVYASELSTGLQQDFTGSATDHARLLMYMLREQQLLNEIALAKIAYANAVTSEEGDARFREIGEKQSELATIRERLAEIPKSVF